MTENDFKIAENIKDPETWENCLNLLTKEFTNFDITNAEIQRAEACVLKIIELNPNKTDIATRFNDFKKESDKHKENIKISYKKAKERYQKEKSTCNLLSVCIILSVAFAAFPTFLTLLVMENITLSTVWLPAITVGVPVTILISSIVSRFSHRKKRDKYLEKSKKLKIQINAFQK